MVGDNGESTAWAKHLKALCEQCFEHGYFVVYLDAKCLKHLCKFFFLLCGLYERTHHIEQLLHGSYLCLGAGFYYGCSQAASTFEFAVEIEDVGKLLFAVFGKHFAGIERAALIHAHIQVSVKSE